MTTAAYLRVSTLDQSIASQRPDVERWLAAQGVDANVYVETGSGRKMDRPVFAALLAQVKAGKVTRVVVWRLDRLGRTAAGLTELFETLREHGCTLVSLKESIDLETPAGRLMAHVLASVAAYETEVRRERVAAGIAAARARGKKWGGRQAGSLNAKTEAKLSLARRMITAGHALALIARETGLSVATVRKISRNKNP